jgi:hypothetical protein
MYTNEVAKYNTYNVTLYIVRTSDQRIYDSYIQINVTREERGKEKERERETGELIKLIKMAMNGIL